MDGSAVVRSPVNGTINNLVWLAGDIALPGGVTVTKFTADGNGAKQVTGTLSVNGISSWYQGSIDIADDAMIAVMPNGVLTAWEPGSGNFTGLGTLQVSGSFINYRDLFSFPKLLSTNQANIQTFGLVVIQESQINGVNFFGYGSFSFYGHSNLTGELQLSSKMDNYGTINLHPSSNSYFSAATLNNYGLIIVQSSIQFDDQFVLGACDSTAGFSILQGAAVTLASSSPISFGCSMSGDGSLISDGNVIFSSSSISNLYRNHSFLWLKSFLIISDTSILVHLNSLLLLV
jgi:hypothetical protein